MDSLVKIRGNEVLEVEYRGCSVTVLEEADADANLD